MQTENLTWTVSPTKAENETEDLITVVAIAMILAFALVLCVPGLHRAMWKTHIATLHTIGLHHGWGT